MITTLTLTGTTLTGAAQSIQLSALAIVIPAGDGSNATHTGEVTGSAALTVQSTAITNKTNVTAAATDELLISDASDSGALKKVTAQSIADLATDTDTVYDPTTIQAEVDANTAKVSNVAHPLVETAVPTGAVFTDTVYNDTSILAAVALNTAKVTNSDQTGAQIKALYEAETNAFTDTQFTKLSSVASNATANSADAALLARANHTGTQLLSTISDAGTAAAAASTAFATAAQGTLAANAVPNAGNTTIAGVKTFSSSPVVPAPTTDLQAATKKYVDDNAGGGAFTEDANGQLTITTNADLDAASGVETKLDLSFEVNQSGSAGYNGLLIDSTETATGTGVKNLIDLKVGGTSEFSVNNVGQANITTNVYPYSASTAAGPSYSIGGRRILEAAGNATALWNYADIANPSILLYDNGIRTGSGYVFGWSSGGNPITSDTALARASAGVVKVTNGSTGNGGLAAKYLQVAEAYTVATLPSGVVGQIARITDGDAPLAWGATAVNSGAGATAYLVWYNGSAWTVTGK